MILSEFFGSTTRIDVDDDAGANRGAGGGGGGCAGMLVSCICTNECNTEACIWIVVAKVEGVACRFAIVPR